MQENRRYGKRLWRSHSAARLGHGDRPVGGTELLAVLPHNPPGREPWEPILEFDRSEHPARQAIMAMPIEHVNGWVDIPSGPGLGIEIDRDALTSFTVS